MPADPRGLVALAAPVLALRLRWHRLALPGCVHDVCDCTYGFTTVRQTFVV